MKKALSIILTVLMLASTLSLFALSTSAAEASAPATGKELVMYVADSGDDANDGLSADKPKKTINGAINYMKADSKVSATGEYTSAKLVLVGDVTIAKSTQTYVHPAFALTVTSADKENARLLLQHNFRIGGETLYTGIKILFTATANQDLRHLICDGNKLTMGLPGVVNDVITYEEGVSTRRLSIAGAFPGWQDPAQEIEKVDVTLNSGEYRFISGAAHAGSLVKGDINFVINPGVIVADGAIAVGGSLKTQTSAKDDTGLRCGGDYTVTINGGTFVNTNIHIGVLKSGNSGYRPCSVAGKTTIDINGGTFNNCKIDTYETLGGVATGDLAADALGVDFKNGITVDLTDIPNADKAKYTAMVGTANTAATPTKNKITVVEHSLVKFEDINDDQHKASCPCGCGKNEMQNHAYDAGETTKQPTHSTAGEKTYTCADCKGTKVETISPDTTTHNYTTGWVKDDDTNHKKTCDDPACPDANKGLVTEAHTWDEGEITKEATHLEEGEKTFKCATCNGTKTEVVAKTSVHSMGDWEKHDAAQHKRVCACGEAKYQDHEWDAGKVTKEATAEAEGEKTFTCSTCGETKVEAVAKLAPVDEGGCGSTVGFGMAAVVVACAAAFVGKKKED